MSKLKAQLTSRKDQILMQLQEYDELQAELAEINKALAALDPPRPSCDSRCSGCPVCRNGMEYR